MEQKPAGGSATRLHSGNRKRQADGKLTQHERPEGEGRCGLCLLTLSQPGRQSCDQVTENTRSSKDRIAEGEFSQEDSPFGIFGVGCQGLGPRHRVCGMIDFRCGQRAGCELPHSSQQKVAAATNGSPANANENAGVDTNPLSTLLKSWPTSAAAAGKEATQ